MKTKKILLAALVGLLMVSCDGSLLVEVVTAEESPDKNYQRLLGVNSSTSTVYYQNIKGLYSNDTTRQESTLVKNHNGNLVQYSFLSYDGNYVLYFHTDKESNDGYQSEIGVYDINSQSTTSASLTIDGVTATSKGYWIKGLQEDGALVVFDQASNRAYVCYPETITTSSVIFKALSDYIDVKNGSGVQYDVGKYYVQRMEAGNYSMITRVKKSADDDGYDDDDFSAQLYFYKWDDSTHTPSLYAISNDDEDIPYRAANFAINKDGTIAYVLCTNGRLYKYTIDTSTKKATKVDYHSSGYSYGTGCLMYYHQYGDKDYFVTKPNYKSRAIIVLEVNATDFSDFDDTSIRKGFADKLDSDLVNCFYELGNNDSTNQSKLLVGTNESGMVSITINWLNVTSNSSSNGSSTDAEKYELPPITW